MITATKLRRGMIFTRIRVGGMPNLGQWGKNPCVTFPCLTQLPPLKTAAVSWGSYGWEWSVAGLLVLAHTHTPPMDWTSRWAGEWLRPHSILSTTPLFPLSVHPHARAVVWLFPCIGFFPVLVSCSQERGAVSTVIHIFHKEESGVFRSVFGDLV